MYKSQQTEETQLVEVLYSTDKPNVCKLRTLPIFKGDSHNGTQPYTHITMSQPCYELHHCLIIPALYLMSLHLAHWFGPTLTYLLTLCLFNNMASVSFTPCPLLYPYTALPPLPSIVLSLIIAFLLIAHTCTIIVNLILEYHLQTIPLS